MTDITTRPPLLAIDLRPKPAGFNEARAVANMRGRVRELCAELTLMFSREPSLEPERTPLVLETAALHVEAAELQEMGRTDE